MKNSGSNGSSTRVAADGQQDEGPIDAAKFRQIMGGFTTGVAVVTTYADGEPHGMTVNSLTAVSLEPLLLLVCLTKNSRTIQAIQKSGRFAVNLLALEQREVSNSFARAGEDHFGGIDVAWTGGVPLIDGSIGHLVCRVSRIDDGGDHDIVLGDVESGETRAGEPLVFYRGRYGQYLPLARTQRDIGIDWFG